MRWWGGGKGEGSQLCHPRSESRVLGGGREKKDEHNIRVNGKKKTTTKGTSEQTNEPKTYQVRATEVSHTTHSLRMVDSTVFSMFQTYDDGNAKLEKNFQVYRFQEKAKYVLVPPLWEKGKNCVCVFSNGCFVFFSL